MPLPLLKVELAVLLHTLLSKQRSVPSHAESKWLKFISQMKRGRQKFFCIEPSRTCKNRKLQHGGGEKSLSLSYMLRIFQFGHAMPLLAWGKAQHSWGALCHSIAEGYHSSVSFGSFLREGIPGTCSAASGGGWLEKKLYEVHKEPPDPSQT